MSVISPKCRRCSQSSVHRQELGVLLHWLQSGTPTQKSVECDSTLSPVQPASLTSSRPDCLLTLWCQKCWLFKTWELIRIFLNGFSCHFQAMYQNLAGCVIYLLIYSNIFHFVINIMFLNYLLYLIIVIILIYIVYFKKSQVPGRGVRLWTDDITHFLNVFRFGAVHPAGRELQISVYGRSETSVRDGEQAGFGALRDEGLWF